MGVEGVQGLYTVGVDEAQREQMTRRKFSKDDLSFVGQRRIR